MKRGTPEHPKTRRLMRALNLPQYAAVGILESLWHFTAKYAIQGDIGRHEDWQIAEGVGWEREPGELVRALCESGWIDECPAHRLMIHDWRDHADQSARKTLKNRDLCFLNVSGKSKERNRKRMEKVAPATGTGKAQERKGTGTGKAEANSSEFPEDFPQSHRTPEFENQWREYVDWRKNQKHKPMTTLAMSKMLKQLAEISVSDAVRLMETGIANDWQGLKADWLKGNSNNGTHNGRRNDSPARPRSDEYRNIGKSSVP